MLTIPTDEPWVPLRILGLGLDGDQQVEADVFLLTDEEPKLLAGGPASPSTAARPRPTALLADLRSDVGMEWVPERDVVDVPEGRRRRRRPRLRPRHRRRRARALPSLTDAGIAAPEAR